MDGVMRRMVSGIMTRLHVLCQFERWQFEDIIQETWAHVSKRNWSANPVSGAAVSTGS